MEESFGGVNTEVSRLYQWPLKLDFLCRFAFLFSLNFRPGLRLNARGPEARIGFVSGFRNWSEESFASSSILISPFLSSDSISRPSIQLSFPSPSDAGSLVIKLLIVPERFISDEYSPSFVYSERGFKVL